MGIGISVLLVAIGAILFWGVTASVAGVSLNVIGVILILAGVIGLIAGVLASSRRETTDMRVPR